MLWASLLAWHLGSSRSISVRYIQSSVFSLFLHSYCQVAVSAASKVSTSTRCKIEERMRTADATHVQPNRNTPPVIYIGFTYRWPLLESKQCVFSNDGNKPNGFAARLSIFSILANSGSAAAVYLKLICFALKCFSSSAAVCIFAVTTLHQRNILWMFLSTELVTRFAVLPQLTMPSHISRAANLGQNLGVWAE